MTCRTKNDLSESAIHDQLSIVGEAFQFFYGSYELIVNKVNNDRKKILELFDDIGDHFFVPYFYCFS